MSFCSGRADSPMGRDAFHGQGEVKCGPLSLPIALRPYAASVKLHEFTRQSESQAGALSTVFGAVVDLLEYVENAFEVFRRYTNTTVRHLNPEHGPPTHRVIPLHPPVKSILGRHGSGAIGGHGS